MLGAVPRVLSGVRVCGGGTGGKCPITWAAGILDQRSWRAVGIRGEFRYNFDSRYDVGEPLFHSSVESAPRLRQLSAVMFLLVEA